MAASVLDSKPTRHAVPKDFLRLILIVLRIMWEAFDNAAVLIDLKILYAITFYFVF